VPGRNWTDAAGVLAKGLTATTDPAARSQLVAALRDGGAQAVSSGSYQGAVSLFREYVRAAPTDVNVYLELGKAYWNSGQRADALAQFRRALELAPQNEEAQRFLLGR